MWSRAAWQYRTSLILLTISQTIMTAIDLAMMLILFTHTHRLGGLDLLQVMFLYSTSYVAFGIADLLVGTVDRLGLRVRTGTFDAMLVRPVGTLAQVTSEEFTPRRAASLLQGLVVLGIALPRLTIAWTPAKILMIPMMMIAGAVIFGALRVMLASLLFLIDGADEVINAFTYGGNMLTQYPLTIYGAGIVRALVWVVPLAFVNWLPTLYVLGLPVPFQLPSVLMFLSPLVALLSLGAASFCWRTGVRHYRSTGS